MGSMKTSIGHGHSLACDFSLVIIFPPSLLCIYIVYMYMYIYMYIILREICPGLAAAFC